MSSPKSGCHLKMPTWQKSIPPLVLYVDHSCIHSVTLMSGTRRIMKLIYNSRTQPL